MKKILIINGPNLNLLGNREKNHYGDSSLQKIKSLCETVCEKGYEICVGGMWANSTAQQPIEEYCNSEDDDCDGQIDEGLDCLCGEADVGILVPCMEDPLVCGKGYKTCVCDVLPPPGLPCTEFKMTDCKASCSYFPVPDTDCDEKLGIVTCVSDPLSIHEMIFVSPGELPTEYS